MTWDKTPYVIGGGAEHTPESFRLLAYAGTAGAEGVVSPGDLKVSQMTVATGQVQVSAGAALLLNRSAAGGQQTYAARNPTPDTVTVAPTTSSGGRSDLVVVRVEDPQYSPWTAPADPVNATYVRTHVIQGVSAATTTAASLNLGYPAIALARIDIPASTAAITNAHIVDLRRVAQPRSHRELEVGYPSVNRNAPVIPGGVNNTWYQLCPINNIAVPTWATTAILIVTVSGLELTTGAFLGDLRANMFGQVVPNVVVDLNYDTNPERYNYVVAGRVPVASQYRGTTTTGALDGRRRSGTGFIQTDTGSTVVTDVTFQEVAG